MTTTIEAVEQAPARHGLLRYAATKAGVSAFTRALAVEWAPHNVQVNAIGPGYVRTKLTEPLFASAEWVERITVMGPRDEIAERIVERADGINDHLGLVNSRNPDPAHFADIVAELKRRFPPADPTP